MLTVSISSRRTLEEPVAMSCSWDKKITDTKGEVYGVLAFVSCLHIVINDGEKEGFIDFASSAGANDVGQLVVKGTVRLMTRKISFTCQARCERGSSGIYARMEIRGESCMGACSRKHPATTEAVAATSRNDKTLFIVLLSYSISGFSE